MSKEYACFEMDSLRYIGICRLDKPDPNGTGHSFGVLCYTLVDTDEKAGLMYFRRDEYQPYLEAL